MAFQPIRRLILHATVNLVSCRRCSNRAKISIFLAIFSFYSDNVIMHIALDIASNINRKLIGRLRHDSTFRHMAVGIMDF